MQIRPLTFVACGVVALAFYFYLAGGAHFPMGKYVTPTSPSSKKKTPHLFGMVLKNRKG